MIQSDIGQLAIIVASCNDTHRIHCLLAPCSPAMTAFVALDGVESLHRSRLQICGLSRSDMHVCLQLSREVSRMLRPLPRK